MCIINSKDIQAIPKKTIIYFTQKTNNYFHIPNSYVYLVPADLSQMIFEMRRFDITHFPIICYDNSNMQLASRAFWIFEALGYEALVVYGNVDLFVQQRVALVKENLGAISHSTIPMEITPGKLDWVDGTESPLEDLFGALRESIQNYCSPAKVEKFLRSLGLDLGKNDWCFSGRDCELLGVLMRYIGKTQAVASLGEWREVGHSRATSRTEMFFSLVSTVYFDVEEANESEVVVREEGDGGKKEGQERISVVGGETWGRKVEFQPCVEEEKEEFTGDTKSEEFKDDGQQYRDQEHYSTSLVRKDQHYKKENGASQGCHCSKCNIF